jgi:hypothetical protein
VRFSAENLTSALDGSPIFQALQNSLSLNLLLLKT